METKVEMPIPCNAHHTKLRHLSFLLKLLRICDAIDFSMLKALIESIGWFKMQNSHTSSIGKCSDYQFLARIVTANPKSHYKKVPRKIDLFCYWQF